MLVVDASVVIKWFVREELHAQATALLVGENELYAPDLLLPEIANVAWKKTMRGEIDASQAGRIATACLEGVPSILPSANFVERGLQMALALDHSLYDCLYLACAEMIGGMLVTSDDAFCRRVQRTTWAPFVRRLGAEEAGG
jgi:predicted nucleic acid-binding protein